MILGFLFFIQTFLKHCKALSTESYKRHINILLLLLLLLLLLYFVSDYRAILSVNNSFKEAGYFPTAIKQVCSKPLRHIPIC